MAQLCHNCGAPPLTLTLLADPESRPAVSSQSPELAHLLKSNDPPLESEIPSIREVIGNGKDRIKVFDAQIDSLETQIHDLRAALLQLQSRRNGVVKSIHQHQSITSPIRRIPAELVCEIFLLAWSSEDAVNKPPWYLGHICRSWRHHALSYPALWLSITVSSSNFASSTLARLGAQLLRSANAPLDIHWRRVHDRLDPRLLNLLLPQSNRWRNLRFEYCGLKNFDWLHSVDGCLHQLQKVEVNSLAAGIDIPDVFSAARNLREVILVDHRFLHSPAIAIPWEQITHHHGTYSPARQLEILRAAAPTLLECSIGFIGDDFDNEASPIVTLPNLRRLSSQYVAFLPYLAAPLLEQLRLLLLAETIGPVGPFIRRSSCTLTRLALIECRIDSKLISLLGDLPTLTSLLLDLDDEEYDINDDWTTVVSISGATSDICPRLTSFELGYQYATLSLWHRVFAMAGSRFQRYSSAQCRLSRLRLFGLPSDTVAAHIQTLRDSGFDAVLLDRDDLNKTLF